MSWRVLHVLDHSWPVLDGYAQRSRSIVASQLSLGMHPAVVTSPLHEQDDPEAHESDFEGVRYFRSAQKHGLAARVISRPVPVLRELGVVRLLQARIARILQAEPFDVVHSHSPALCGLAAARAARSARLPFVYEVRAFWEDAAVDQNKAQPDSWRYRLSRGLETRVLSQADAIVAISQSLLHDIERRGIVTTKLFHVPNGVDPERFTPQPRDSALATELGLGNLPILGFLGTLFPWEGVSELIPAVAELRRRGLAFKMLIVGDGADASRLKAAIETARVSDDVLFLGRVPNQQVERYYSLMDILVYPRRSARLTELVTPLKPLEAMAFGKPVLGSSVGGIRELVEPDTTGLLFQPGNVEDFCSKATRLLLDSALRTKLGACARQTMLAERNWKTLTKRYEQVYALARSSLIAHPTF